MTAHHGNKRRYLLIAVISVAVLSALYIGMRPGGAAPAGDSPTGPVAYFGHGQALDAEGRQVTLTVERIISEQVRLIEVVAKDLPVENREAFVKLQSQLREASVGNERDTVITQAALVYWLLNAEKRKDADRLRTLNAGLMFAYPRAADLPTDDPEFWERLSEKPRFLLDEEGFKWPWVLIPPAEPNAYMNDCRNAGVPVPPAWGSPEWLSHGELKDKFLTVDAVAAEVFVYTSTQPEGLCMALPRSTGNVITTLQIICQGKQSSRACFWDNRRNGVQWPIEKGQSRLIQDFTDGFNITHNGENCTDCHAGFNAFIVHPGTELDLTALGINMQPAAWYVPLISPAAWQNHGPETTLSTIALGMARVTVYAPVWGWFPWWRTLSVQEQSCNSCHQLPAFGHFSTPRYCSLILPSAVERTMPPGSVHAGWDVIRSRTDLAFEKHVNALRQACGLPPARRDISISSWVD